MRARLLSVAGPAPCRRGRSARWRKPVPGRGGAGFPGPAGREM